MKKKLKKNHQNRQKRQNHQKHRFSVIHHSSSIIRHFPSAFFFNSFNLFNTSQKTFTILVKRSRLILTEWDMHANIQTCVYYLRVW